MERSQQTYEELLTLTRTQAALIKEQKAEIAHLRDRLKRLERPEAQEAEVIVEIDLPSEAIGAAETAYDAPTTELEADFEEPVVAGVALETAQTASAVDASSSAASEEEKPHRVPSQNEPVSPESAVSAVVRRTPSIDAFDEDLSDLGTVSQVYRTWNRVVFERLLLPLGSGRDVYLTVTPRVLAAAFAEGDAGGGEDAAKRLSDAVSAMYRTRVLGHRGRLAVLRRIGEDGLPECGAFLALSVLAAYCMQSDEGAPGHAYYYRLTELLNCGSTASGAPSGFDTGLFESLWLFVQRWLGERRGSNLIVPGPEVGLRRYVAIPLAHVPLRCLDIERLPDFFAWAGYPPNARIPEEKLRTDLLHWEGEKSALTPAGAAALMDERLGAVLAQVASELESWDGSVVSVRRRSAMVEVQLDFIRMQPVLYFLPRRAAGFPLRFDDGEHCYESADDGWYNPEPVRSEDGPKLRAGFEWSVVEGQQQLILRRPASHAIPLTPSRQCSGFLSSRGLMRGIVCAALCEAEAEVEAKDYLSFISSKDCRPSRHERVPEGWSLFTEVKPMRASCPPQVLDSLAVDLGVEVIPVGGLRLGRGFAWLQGAAPKLLVSGLDPDGKAFVDGKAVPIGADGVLQVNGALSSPGVHVVEAGGTRRNIEIASPSLPTPRGRKAVDELPTSRPAVVALPRGDWTLIGALPGEVFSTSLVHQGGGAARCGFAPVWAIRVGTGRGAEVLCVSRVPSLPLTSPVVLKTRDGVSRLRRWTEVVYTAGMRRPKLQSLFAAAEAEDLDSVWRAYRATARESKHRLKGMRR